METSVQEALKIGLVNNQIHTLVISGGTGVGKSYILRQCLEAWHIPYRLIPIYVEDSQFSKVAEIFHKYLEMDESYVTEQLAQPNLKQVSFGTKGNGVYLISADNMTQVQHFLTSNSGLLSNNLYSISINNTTGEVFFATDKGLCSYMSDATKAEETTNDDAVYAYPNPVMLT